MREIKFRGKDIKTGEWIIGDLIRYSKIDPFTYISIGIGYKVDDKRIGKLIKVFSDTVGQYTGLKDKNGTGQEVYEGDIIDKEGNIKGNIYENNAGEADLVIQGFGTKDWETTNKEALARGLKYAQ